MYGCNRTLLWALSTLLLVQVAAQTVIVHLLVNSMACKLGLSAETSRLVSSER